MLSTVKGYTRGFIHLTELSVPLICPMFAPSVQGILCSQININNYWNYSFWDRLIRLGLYSASTHQC